MAALIIFQTFVFVLFKLTSGHTSYEIVEDRPNKDVESLGSVLGSDISPIEYGFLPIEQQADRHVISIGSTTSKSAIKKKKLRKKQKKMHHAPKPKKNKKKIKKPTSNGKWLWEGYNNSSDSAEFDRKPVDIIVHIKMKK